MVWVCKKSLETYADGVLSDGCEKNTVITVSDGMFSGRYLFNKINDFDVSVREVDGSCIHNIENDDETYTFLFFMHGGAQKINGDVLGAEVLYLLKPTKKLLTKSEWGSSCVALSVSRKRLAEYKEKVGFPRDGVLNDKIACSPRFFKSFKKFICNDYF